ncbi:MAG: FIST C-terminal domain-containing protein [Anaerolineaceae bacterium]|nr:FIST C-terminal domain-containing protein [Anaerolineaceae bacterium]
MTQSAAWGVAKSLNSRDAARDAVQQALRQMGTAARPALILAFVSVGLDAKEAASGISDVLPNVPVWGMSAIGLLSRNGEEGRAVVVGLVGGSKLEATLQWWPDSSLNQAQKTTRIFRDLCKDYAQAAGLLLALDGLGLNGAAALGALQDFPAPVAAGLGSGDFRKGKTVQFCGEDCGEGSAAAVLLGGRFRMGVGMAHGWHPAGVSFTSTSRKGALGVQQLNGVPAAEAFAQVFQHPVREWSSPPLKELARVYALGIPQEEQEILIRSAVHVEVDGSFRMNAPIPEDAQTQLMIGSLESCIFAARQAAQAALEGLGEARPLLAVLLVDIAWQYLFESRSHEFVEAVLETLGGIPLVGAYTMGQAVSQGADDTLVLQNQHLQVILLGEAEV